MTEINKKIIFPYKVHSANKRGYGEEKGSAHACILMEKEGVVYVLTADRNSVYTGKKYSRD